MKTKKYSVSMKTITAVLFAFVFSAFLNAQFEVPSPSTPGSQTAEDVRALSNVDYDITVVGGESVRWAVIGGTITTAGAAPSGDSSVIEFTPGLSTITVNWDEDLTSSPIGSGVGQIIVQKTTGSGCPSQLQILNITQWNNPEADLVDPALSICSGEPVGGNITINVKGAPDDGSDDGFTVTYNVTAAGLTDLGGNALVNATGSIAASNIDEVIIALPDGLINSTDAPIDYVVTLTAMTDDFTTPDGVLTSDGTYTITVNPVPETGDIQSSSSLTRR